MPDRSWCAGEAGVRLPDQGGVMTGRAYACLIADGAPAGRAYVCLIADGAPARPACAGLIRTVLGRGGQYTQRVRAAISSGSAPSNRAISPRRTTARVSAKASPDAERSALSDSKASTASASDAGTGAIPRAARSAPSRDAGSTSTGSGRAAPLANPSRPAAINPARARYGFAAPSNDLISILAA